VGDLEKQKRHLFSGCKVGGSEPAAGKVVKDDSQLVPDPEDAAKLEAWAAKLDEVRERPPRLMWNQPG
jgi:hypothetical protein